MIKEPKPLLQFVLAGCLELMPFLSKINPPSGPTPHPRPRYAKRQDAALLPPLHRQMALDVETGLCLPCRRVCLAVLDVTEADETHSMGPDRPPSAVAKLISLGWC